MKKYLIANWKMHTTAREADSFLSSVTVVNNNNIEVGIAPPATHLCTMREHAQSLNIKLGAQNMHESKCGAYTGEISALMLREAGAEFVIIGHSERRHFFHETDVVLEKKIETAVVEDIPFILCVGETKAHRDAMKSEEVVKKQLAAVMTSLTSANIKECKIAYEPVWAIGTGQAASSDIIEEMHGIIREELIKLFGSEGEQMPILYGGSVGVDNLEGLLIIDNVDGTLVGRAALDPEAFNELICITGESL